MTAPCWSATGRPERSTGFRAPKGSSTPSGSTRVERVEEVVVLLVDDAPLHLERRSQLAGLLGKIVVEDRELLDLLDLGVFGVHLVELVLDQLPDLLAAHELSHLGRKAALARPGH